ncbi:hypothetical protein [Aneurinibacillus tyrosinisolvens]|uniref:hypothetical protein n=1 Tax=Aneurinibacillus tyrosinisolvens TaxID=1443435 RepID=UPI00063F1F51|nr:hypothetical protein [Aneurinibacillus tyrosinisolvens]
MNNPEGVFTAVSGSGKVLLDNNKIIHLTLGDVVKVLHPQYGWQQGIYQGESQVDTPLGIYELTQGDTVRIEN